MPSRLAPPCPYMYIVADTNIATATKKATDEAGHLQQRRQRHAHLLGDAAGRLILLGHVPEQGAAHLRESNVRTHVHGRSDAHASAHTTQQERTTQRKKVMLL